MSSTQHIRHILVLAALAVCAAGTAHAQSPLRAIARAFSGGKQPAAQPTPTPNKSAALASDPSLGVSHGYRGVTPNAEVAAAQARSAFNSIAEKLPTFGGKNAADFGSELEEGTSTLAVNLFNNPEIRKLLGDNPRFIYDTAGKSDPMVVPWVRRAAIFKELMARADQQIIDGKLDDALATYKKVLDMRDQRFVAAVQLKLSELAKLKQVDAAKLANAQAASGVVETVELPTWVQENTTGVLFEKDRGRGNNLCLVGEYMLHVGEALPNYPEVTVAAIGEKSVTYRVRDREFNVQLNSEPMTNTPPVKVTAVNGTSAQLRYRNQNFKLEMIK
ncbi:hypothetical protein LLG95_00755 [bacterium]|nr:hypothetical protein [bacterium]